MPTNIILKFIYKLLFKNFAKPANGVDRPTLKEVTFEPDDTIINPHNHCKDCINPNCRVKLISTCDYKGRYVLISRLSGQ
jgi:hypothetical protein